MVWPTCLEHLKEEIAQKEYDLWIRPLQTVEDGETLRVFVPNTFFLKRLEKDGMLDSVKALLETFSHGRLKQVSLEVGSLKELQKAEPVEKSRAEPGHLGDKTKEATYHSIPVGNGLDPLFTFDSYVSGKSNQLAYAACLQVAENPGTKSHNPLFIYGPTGLGKTHLMHSIGNAVLKRKPTAKIFFVSSEKFVSSFVTALRNGPEYVNSFKQFYRSLDLLLIDDIQFFAGKGSTQEEFFYTFNTLLEGSRQIILTSDKFPKEIKTLDERLQSRCTWGLTIQVEPPELETRVAILMKKAKNSEIELPETSAFFIAQHVQANVRELEGAFNRVVAMSRFKKKLIDVEMVKEALSDILAVRAKLISIENIQRVVAEYFNIPLRELTGKKRTRNYARPRQLAMALSRELTSHSYPEIGQYFDGRDHSTVIHACEKIDELRKSDTTMETDYKNLLRSLQA